MKSEPCECHWPFWNNGLMLDEWINESRKMTWNMASVPVIASAWFSGWEPLWSACCCCGCCQLPTVITGLEVTVISLLFPVTQMHCERLLDLQEAHHRSELMKMWKNQWGQVQHKLKKKTTKFGRHRGVQKCRVHCRAYPRGFSVPILCICLKVNRQMWGDLERNVRNLQSVSHRKWWKRSSKRNVVTKCYIFAKKIKFRLK